MFPSLYEDEIYPLDGYGTLTFRLLVNPTQAVRTAWLIHNLGGCEKCEALKPADAPRDAPPVYCPACLVTRAAFSAALSQIYRDTQLNGFDFSTPETALATIESPDLPADLVSFLYIAPLARWERRTEDLKKKLRPSSPSPT